VQSKSKLLKKANEEFPTYWESICQSNPHLQLLTCKTFPTVLQMTVGEINHERGIVALILFDMKTEEGETLQLTGVSFQSCQDAFCEFVESPKELRQFVDEFANNLIFNIMFREGLTLAGWKNLPD